VREVRREKRHGEIELEALRLNGPDVEGVSGVFITCIINQTF